MVYKRILLFIWMLVLGTPKAVIDVEVNKGRFSAVPLSVLSFYSETANEFELGKDVSQVVAADLSWAGIARIVSRSTNSNECNIPNQKPNYSYWGGQGADMVLYGTIKTNGNMVSVNCYLGDVITKRQLMAFNYSTNRKNWRKLAHKISDAIYKRLTGERGYFTCKIAYVSETGSFNRRAKRLSIMDYDGENHRFLTKSGAIIMTPRFSPDGKKLIYFAIANRKPHVYIYDLDTGYHKSIGHFEGMSYAPRFSPDGKSVIFSIANNLRSSIYTLDLTTHKRRRLTNTNAIDTSPCYSPDKKTIAFVSDRDGSPQIFLMDAQGRSQRRISYGSGRYFTPVWSPNGDYIAFTKTLGGTFYVGVMNRDGSGERLLTQGYFVEAPSWSPNGKVITFTRRSPAGKNNKQGVARVYTVDVSGTNEREIITPMDGTDPDWSPIEK